MKVEVKKLINKKKVIMSVPVTAFYSFQNSIISKIMRVSLIENIQKLFYKVL